MATRIKTELHRAIGGKRKKKAPSPLAGKTQQELELFVITTGRSLSRQKWEIGHALKLLAAFRKGDGLKTWFTRKVRSFCYESATRYKRLAEFYPTFDRIEKIGLKAAYVEAGIIKQAGNGNSPDVTPPPPPPVDLPTPPTATIASAESESVDGEPISKASSNTVVGLPGPCSTSRKTASSNGYASSLLESPGGNNEHRNSIGFEIRQSLCDSLAKALRDTALVDQYLRGVKGHISLTKAKSHQKDAIRLIELAKGQLD